MKILDWKDSIDYDELNNVCDTLKSGGLVIFPTETVYGIGANALDSKAVDNIFIAKGRANDNPLIGLHEFKKKFGGDYVEFIGEWDYVTNPIMYFVFTKLVPIYRNIIKKKNKKVLKSQLEQKK